MTYSPRRNSPSSKTKLHVTKKKNKKNQQMKIKKKPETLTSVDRKRYHETIDETTETSEQESTTSESPDLLTSTSQSTGLVYDERMLKHKHEWFIEEQESPRRIQQAFQRCLEEDLVSRCVRVPAHSSSDNDLALVHDKGYIKKVKESAKMTKRELYSLSGQYDGVFFNHSTWLCAKLAAGSVKRLTHLVYTGRLANGLALVRPPGHHAMQSEACGYCIFNNIAIAAASLLQPRQMNPSSSSSALPGSISQSKGSSNNELLSAQRILIVDWDIHHGQGTQYTFYDDNRVLFISIHRYEKGNFWPNLREANYDFIGEGLGKGYNINIPLEDIGMTDSDYLAIFHQIILPIATEFNPQLILISCGFDAAIGCPEGRMWLSPMVFGHFVHELKSLAGGKVVIVLEGGYFVDSLAEGTVHVLKALLGDPLSPLQLIRPPCSSVKRTIKSCIVALRDHWKSIGTADISQIIPRPSLKHLPNISWSLMKNIAWPETNPQLPRVLTNHIQQLLSKHFPAPLSILNKHGQGGDPQLTLILMPTSPSSLSMPSLLLHRASSSVSLSMSSSLTTLSTTSTSSSSTTSTLPVRHKSIGVKRLPHHQHHKRQRQQKQQQQQKEQDNQENRSSITESLLKKLHGKVHIHFYNDHDTSAVDYICPGEEFNPIRKSQLIEPASSSSQHLSSRKDVKQLNNDADDNFVSGVKSRHRLKRIHEKSTQRVKGISTEVKCNCSFYPMTSKGRIVEDAAESIEKIIKEPFLNLQTAFTQALISVFMGEFHRLYISVKSLNLLQFINAITDIPLHFLSNYRERIFRPRYFQMNNSKTNNNSNSKSGINNDNNNNNSDRTVAYINSFKQLKNESMFNIPIVKDESLKQLANVYSPSSSSSPASMDSLPLSTASASRSSKSVSTPSKFKGKSRFPDRHSLEKIIGYKLIKSEDFFIKPCRVLVLDLAGNKEFNDKKIKEINTSLSGVTSQNIQCDIIWCSVYHGELADQLIRKPEELRAKELCNSSINCTSKASTVSSANRINNLIWLKIPIPRTTASQAVEKTEATHSSNKKRTSLSSPSASSHPSTQSQTPNYATNTINLLSIIYHIFLPISYEFGPDLVYLLIGSNEDDYNFITPDTSARLLYLLNGLGAAVIVNGTSQQLCSDSLVGSLLGKPLPTGFDETQSTSPSSGVKQAIHLVMEQNHQRWKFLKFCGSLPKWT